MPEAHLINRLRMQLRHRPKGKLSRPPKWLNPETAARTYSKHLLQVVNNVEVAYRKHLAPKLPALVADAARVRGDSWATDLATILASVRLDLDKGSEEAEQMTLALAGQVSTWNLGQWRKIVKDVVGVDLFSMEPWLLDDLKSWAHENAQLVGSLEDDAVKNLSIWTQRGIRDGWRWEDIAANLEDRFDVDRRKAEFIAVDQIGTLNSQLTQKRQEAAGVTGYIWRSSHDERVRGNPGGLYPKAIPSHYDRDGQRFSWDKTDWEGPYDGPPGRPPRCRCTAEPDLSGLLEAIE